MNAYIFVYIILSKLVVGYGREDPWINTADNDVTVYL